MNCEIVTIGTELLLGQIVDTNASWLAEALNRAGIAVIRHTTVGDVMEDNLQALDAALDRASIVITSGGLGPTEDDLTRQAVAGVLGVDLEFRQDLMDYIEDIFKRSGFKMTPTNRRQAYIPAGTVPILNPVGTAPGFIGERRGSIILTLPGVPRELKYLMTHTVLPYLKERFHLGDDVIHYRVLSATGLGESGIDAIIGDLVRGSSNPEVGLLASPGNVRIRISARGANMLEAKAVIAPVEAEIRTRLGDLIFGEDLETLEGVVDRILKENDLRVSVMETFTGGAVSARMNRAGSVGFAEGRTMADPDRFTEWLQPGGESSSPEALAGEAARKLLAETGTGMSLAVVGRWEEKDRGFIVNAGFGAAGPWGVVTALHELGGDHQTIVDRGAIIGLNHIRKALLARQRERKVA